MCQVQLSPIRIQNFSDVNVPHTVATCFYLLQVKHIVLHGVLEKNHPIFLFENLFNFLAGTFIIQDGVI